MPSLDFLVYGRLYTTNSTLVTMGGPSSDSNHPSLSALQSLINNTTIRNKGDSEPHLQQLALQVAHHLQYQQNWTQIRIHHHSSNQASPLPRPMISGLPPQRLYVHPDEQIQLLQRQKSQGKSGLPDLPTEREWVLPTHLRERWTLRKFAEVFDAIATTPDAADGEELFVDRGMIDTDLDSEANAQPSCWRSTQPKRLLLATVDDDSTVVFYIVHDGIVKPRQN